MTVIKVSDDLMKKLGASNASEFLSIVTSLADQPDVTQSVTNTIDIAPILSGIKELKTDFVALSALVLENTKSEVDMEAVIKAATIAASKITSGALAATGTNPAPIGVPNTNPVGATQIADDDHEGQWKASEQLRGEFGGNFKTYSAYKSAEKNGRFKLLTK